MFASNLEVPKWKGFIDQCLQYIIMIKDSDNNDMEVYVVISKRNEGKTGMPALINFHGGGAYLSEPKYEQPWASRLAHENNVVVLSVKYRLAPEVQYPTGHKDAQIAIEYFYNNADKHGIDKNRICTTGMSGGGWIAMGSAILMARENKSHMVKVMILTCPMLNDHVI